jgi:Ca-activated chloride channel family protein
MESHDKLDLVKEGLSHLIDNLTKDDTISIVTYSGAEKVLVDGANGSEHANIKRALDYMVADGATNGEAGLRMAYDAAEKHFIDGGVNRIIICSDGDFNVGMSSLSDIHSFVDEKKKTGVYLSVLGYGSGNYSDSAMETIADHGNGAYYYIDSIEESDKVLIDDMRKNLTPLADDVKMQVEFNPAEVKAYRMIGYDNRQLAAEDFRDDSVDAGDIGPDTAFTVAYELVLDGSEFQLPEIKETKYGNQAKGEKNGEWLTATIRYKPFGSDEHLEQEAAFGERDVESRENDDWSFIASVIETAMVLKDSQYKGTADIRMAEDTLRQLPSSYMDEDKKGFQDLVARIRDLMENRSMPEDGSTVDLDQDIYLYGKDSE